MYEKPRELLVEALTGRKRHREKAVLQDISFEVSRGEVVGVIGQNGAGKSTLLKIIAKTLKPSAGSADVNGRVAAILELGTGFNPNYTGRENVIMSGMLRGMTEGQVWAKLDSIIAFSGLAHVIDEPFHTYSSGMQARLAFATAISVDADVIIIDEALAAGDVRFASRSLRRIREISQSGVTCLFVSHVTYQIMQLCSRVIWIDQGRVRMDGPAIDVVRAYEYEMHTLVARDRGEALNYSGSDSLNATDAVLPDSEQTVQPVSDSSLAPLAPMADRLRSCELSSAVPGDSSAEPTDGSAEALADSPDPGPRSLRGMETEPLPLAHDPDGVVQSVPAPPASPSHYSTRAYRILRIRFLDAADNETMIFRFGEVFRLQVVYERLEPGEAEFSCGLAAAFNRVADFEAVMYFNTVYPHSDSEIADYHSLSFRQFKGRHGLIEARIDPLQLKAGEYYVSLGILPNTPTHHEFYEYMHCQFKVVVLPNGFDEPSVFYPAVTWSNESSAQ
jgi:ABC-type polysaccharide/polyol phosphate transport system ATPase subunit